MSGWFIEGTGLALSFTLEKPMSKRWQLQPGTAPHPGETIREWLEERGWTQVNFADSLGVSPKHLNQIIKGHNLYSADFAIRLERTTRVDAEFWMGLKTNYELNHAMVKYVDVPH